MPHIVRIPTEIRIEQRTVEVPITQTVEKVINNIECVQETAEVPTLQYIEVPVIIKKTTAKDATDKIIQTELDMNQMEFLHSYEVIPTYMCSMEFQSMPSSPTRPEETQSPA